jgi:hypothetical protein
VLHLALLGWLGDDEAKDIGYAQVSTVDQRLDLQPGAIALAVVLPLIARAFWRIGLRHYSGASA